MPSPHEPLLAVRGLVAGSTAILRPLRIRSLAVGRGDRIAVAGLDGPSAELLVNLLTGAMLPDEGEVTLFGRGTATFETETDWFAALDRIGMVSHRAVLLAQLTIAQNLAMALTLDIDPIPAEILPRVQQLATEVGLESLDRPLSASRERRGLVHLARAIAPNPELLLLEHPTLEVTETASTELAAAVVRVAKRRSLAVLALTADRKFARQVATRRLRLEPASGVLKPGSAFGRWF